MFGHLQIYSAYSFQESTLNIERLVKRASELGLERLALTDKNNLYGAMEFMQACQRYHIHPIYGMEASIRIDSEVYPVLLLAKDTDGYFELCKLSSDILLDEQQSVDFQRLTECKHTFVLLAGEQSIVYRLLVKEMNQEAIRKIQLFLDAFGERFYLCLIDHHIALQKEINEKLIGLAKMTHTTCVCANQVAYLNSNEAYTLELLKASKNNLVLTGKEELRTNQAYLKSEAEMARSFDAKIMAATRSLLLKCEATIPCHQMHLAKFPTPKNADSQAYLNALCQVGLKKRFQSQPIPKKYIERLRSELTIIGKMQFADYFLIVYDYVLYAKRQGILVGPGRGSACGSLVAYVLGITNIDPIAYGLIFERFLNPERVSMPDIDVDFQDDRREEVVNYVVERYGQSHVCQIVTFNTYGPKVALRDLGKVLGVSPVKLEQLAKSIPNLPRFKKSAREVYEQSAHFQNMVNKDPTLKRLMPSVFIVENLPRNISTHPAGVVLSKDVLREVVPLASGPSHTLVSQYSKDYIEDIGLLKMDFLALKDLTMVAYILNDIEKHMGKRIRLNEIPLDDAKTYQLIASGDTFGVFQLESEGMISLLRKMKVSTFEDIVAANALYRPGPMENIPLYLARKFHKEPIDYMHEDLKSILEPTYGVMIYQEQIMQVAQKFAGFTMARADVLRKAVTKKGTQLMADMQSEFINGAIANGYDEKLAHQIFETIAKFADYGFNRSHSVAYALLAYQIAYLKRNYPLYFFAAFLTSEQGSERSKLYGMQEMRKYDVSLLKPSVNHCNERFTVENGNIRYALTAIKNVGYASYQSIFEEYQKNGEFKDIFDFMRRMAPYHLSIKVLESLCDAGAFDEFGYSRRTLKNNLELLKENAEIELRYQGLVTDGQDGLILKNVEEDKNWERLENEKKVLGIYLSTHPVVLYREKISVPTVQVGYFIDYVSRKITAVLCIERIKTIRDRKGQDMCFLVCYDETGKIDCTLFSQQYETYRSILKKGAFVCVSGKVEFRDSLSLIIQQMKKL